MKIAFLNIYNGLVDRGAETFIKELAARLARKHSVTVFQSGDKSGGEKYKVVKTPIQINVSKRRDVKTVQGRLFLDYKSRKKALFTIKAIPTILREKFDIIIPVNGGWQPALVRLVTWFYGGKMVISGQAGMGWDERNNLWCFPNAFVALSTKAKNWARRVNPLVRVLKIPNGTDLMKFKHQGPKLDINLKKPIVLCVGALTPGKRIDLAVKAVGQLKNVSLLITGDGFLKEEILKLGESLLGKRFRLINLPFEDMPKVYRTSNLFTLPSEAYQAFEIVLVEAMATGLPVVANDDEIRKEIVGEAGLLVDPVDTVKYAQALKKALTTDWEDKPRHRAKMFDWDKIATDYEKLFEKL